MAKREKAPYKFVRKGNSLIPEMEYDSRALDGIAQGQGVRVDIGQWRNLSRLRAYWAMLQECVDATDCAPHKEALDAYVRPAVGHVDIVRLANGKYQAVPRPINTQDCDEPEMIAFFQSAEKCLASEFGFVSERPIPGPSSQAHGRVSSAPSPSTRANGQPGRHTVSAGPSERETA